ncbi:MAG: glycogen synthase [bacterium]|nr:glycogen synthase [bacterium]
MGHFFEPGEIGTIKCKLQHLEPENVVFCSFESRFAKSGGLAAVVSKVLPYLKEKERVQRVLLMTPFYPHIIDENKLTATGTTFNVKTDKKTVKVDIYKYMGEVEEYYLKAGDFFESRNNINDPYGYYPDDPRRNDDAIRYNALFFCKAVPLALQALGITKDIAFHLQEWQTAPIALTAKKAMLAGTLDSCGCVQTIHNPFDSWLSPETSGALTGDKSVRDGFTAYQLGLQLVDAPLTTVSGHFAEELTSDLLQTGHFASHLQDIFKKNGVYGVNNGLFIDFPPEYLQKEVYSTGEIKKIKEEKRHALLEVLDTYRPPERFGQLTFQSGSIARLPGKIPILVMSGRLDPFQKGFDILLRAAARFREDEIKVVLTPMATKASHLDYFRETAEKCKGNITVFPMRMEKGFRELQMGSTFGIMPSIYEPFGAAIEYMVGGTVTVARETGGLVDQVRHKECGFLFRESPEFYTLDNIDAFARSGERVSERTGNQWVESMVDALYKILEEATAIYQNHQNDYYRMIAEGFKQAKTFTWQRAAERYFQMYRKIKQV